MSEQPYDGTGGIPDAYRSLKTRVEPFRAAVTQPVASKASQPNSNSVDLSNKEVNLEQRIDEVLRQCLAHAVMQAQGFHGGMSLEEAKQQLLSLIASERLDELERTYPNLQKHHSVSGEGNYYYSDRKVELQAQIEGVNHE